MLLSILLLALATIVSAADFDWDCTHSLAPCNNACFAIHCKKKHETLKYDDNQKHADDRRKESGQSKTPCSDTKLPYHKFGNSCDEFPFATVHEGGKDAILRCVAGSENSSQGKQLGDFYKKIKNGNTFKVFIKNWKGAKYCEAKPDCKNDGGEFKLEKDKFVNAKVRRDLSIGRFETIQDSNTTVAPADLRKFMGEDGVERLLLSGDEGVSIVGREVWGNELGSISITEEIFD